MGKYIIPLNMDGLNGRMLRMPASGANKQEILLVGGHHTSIERMFGLAEVLSTYGNVTLPDLPGFGGMEPFYKLGIVPNIDSFADYLAALIKLRYKRKKVVVVGFSYSVPILIRMLQKYPELEDRVKYIVSISGFAHKEDFKLQKSYINALKTMSYIGSKAPVSWFLKYFIVRKFLIRSTYLLATNSNPKMRTSDKSELRARIDFETKLWLDNDLRTWFKTMGEMFQIDLCDGKKIETAIYHIATENDVYFKHSVTEQHLKIISDHVEVYFSTMPEHAPTVVATAKEVEPFFPKKLKTLLSKS